MATPMAIFNTMFSIAALVCAAIAYFNLRRVIKSLKWPKVMASPRSWIDHYENYTPMYKTEWTFLDFEGPLQSMNDILAKEKFVGILRTMTSKLVDFWIIYLD